MHAYQDSRYVPIGIKLKNVLLKLQMDVHIQKVYLFLNSKSNGVLTGQNNENDTH